MGGGDAGCGLFRKTRDWALRPDFPDPTYDLKSGWTLDQFAMCSEPDLLRLYKDIWADFHRPPGTPEKYDGLRQLEVRQELPEKVKLRLLDNRFRTEGFRPGSYDPEEIPRPLLEAMHPNIVTSELVEVGSAKPRLRFEKVRVFDRSANKTSAAGTKPTYDWPTLKGDLERNSPDISSVPALVGYCRTQVRPVPGKRGSRDGPSDKTIREAIATHGLEKFIKSNKPG